MLTQAENLRQSLYLPVFGIFLTFFCDRLLSVFSFFIGVKSKDISSFCVTFRNDDGNLRSWTVHVNRCIYWKLSRFYWN